MIEQEGQDYDTPTDRRVAYEREMLDTTVDIVYVFDAQTGDLKSGETWFPRDMEDRVDAAPRERFGDAEFDEGPEGPIMMWDDQDGDTGVAAHVPQDFTDYYLVTYVDLDALEASADQAEEDAEQF